MSSVFDAGCLFTGALTATARELVTGVAQGPTYLSAIHLDNPSASDEVVTIVIRAGGYDVGIFRNTVGAGMAWPVFGSGIVLDASDTIVGSSTSTGCRVAICGVIENKD